MDEIEREGLLRERIKAMPPDRFEQLVYEMAHHDDERIERVEHPDGGADTILPRGKGEAARVWQAKRHSKNINWGDCRASLADAIKRWRPQRVTFVFPRDLSEKPRSTFDKQLVNHPDATAGAVAVDHWNLSKIISMLGNNRDLTHRFWPDLEGHMDKLDRFIKAGGKLETAQDLVERAHALGDFGERDANFKTAVTTGGLDTEAPDFATLPYMTIDIHGETTRVHIASWVRDGAEVERSSIAFNEDEPGQTARIKAVRTLATGKVAKVTEGFCVAMVAPEIIKALTKGMQLNPGSFDLLPGDPLALRLDINVGDCALAYTVELRPVPPPPRAAAAWGGFIGRTLLELSFTLLDRPAIRAALSFSGNLEGSAAERAESATLIHAICSHDKISLHSDVLFPGGNGVLSGRFENLGHAQLPAGMDLLRDFFADVAFIESHLDIELPLPPQISPEDMDAAHTIVNVLRTGEGSATFNNMAGEVEDPTTIPDLPAHVKGAVEEVTYPFLGKTISLGMGRYEFPRLKVVKIVPLGTTPTAPARVTLTADGDPEMTFRLVDWSPPEDGP